MFHFKKWLTGKQFIFWGRGSGRKKNKKLSSEWGVVFLCIQNWSKGVVLSIKRGGTPTYFSVFIFHNFILAKIVTSNIMVKYFHSLVLGKIKLGNKKVKKE